MADPVVKIRNRPRLGGGKRKNRDGRKALRCAVAAGTTEPKQRQWFTGVSWEPVPEMGDRGTQG